LSTFPRTPKILKGAIVSIDLVKHVQTVVPFQYNPDVLTRTLTPQYPSGQGSRAEALRLKGPPVEDISLDIELDATNALEHPDKTGNKDAATLGILPQLAALEIITYPASSLVEDNTKAADKGNIEIMPADSLFTVFVWGEKRVLPVRLTNYQIAEEAFDTNLNPIRAKVSLKLQVLTYDDFDSNHRGYSMFLAHQKAKEDLAKKGTTSSLKSVLPGTVNLA
jgi:hypothetical protein